jgi:hypothetical protein
VDAKGDPIPDAAFENEVQVRPIPLKGAQRAAFNERIEALRRFKKT